MEITEITTGEAAQALSVGDAPEGTEIVAEILKSLHTPRSKKDKQAMVFVRVSSWNLLHSKLSMEEKGKAITIEMDEEEEDLEDLIIMEDDDECMEEKTQLVHHMKKFPTYVPPTKREGKST